MKKTLQIWLKPGERIFVNGAVLRADRKVALEFLNDVNFLLESHVLQAEDTKTPLQQLYFIVQTMLIDPQQAWAARELFEKSYGLLMASFDDPAIRSGIESVSRLVQQERLFDALKTIRSLFPIEADVLAAAENQLKQKGVA
jgi:flagellar protein FlbT